VELEQLTLPKGRRSADKKRERRVGQIEGRAAIVTGGGSGIGEATAKLFAREGARLLVADIVGERAERVAGEIRAAGGEAVAHTVDVSLEADVVRMCEAAMAAYGRLDILHNNAAIFGAPTDIRITDVDVETWDRMFAVNVRGTFLGCKHAVPRMLKGGRGAIVNMSSLDGFIGDLQRTAYASSKSAISSLTMSVATQFGKAGIRCNAVAPGMTLSPPVRASMGGDVAVRMARHFLAPNLAEPENLASVVLFLASDAAYYVNGHVLRTDAGAQAHAPWFAETYDPETATRFDNNG
jgi:NAD(P)-dependent dehydrogenase (short-subunit alcohol dehydrogenase family)